MALVGVQTRLTWEEYDLVRMLAEIEQRSLSQSVRFLVREALETRDLLEGSLSVHRRTVSSADRGRQAGV
ncbi:MAG: hypothetical protein ACE5HA_09005 [Anaerolineae bacterium]